MTRKLQTADLRDPDLIRNLNTHLIRFVTPERIEKFRNAIALRTRHITVVLEDIFQPHNASAVLRSCDCFGIQEIHIIENRNKYQVNPDVALGSSKWLELRQYSGTRDNTTGCIENLKANGYRIIATTPHNGAHTPENLPLDQKAALLFGTELEGLTPAALRLADDFIRIPMVGLTESLNISVSAAILLHTLTVRLRSSSIAWQLLPADRERVLLEWLRQSISRSDAVVRTFLATYKPL